VNEGKVVSIAVSERTGEKKLRVAEAYLEADLGIRGDAHARGGPRQVSLLMDESIERMRAGTGIEVAYGDFAENIVTSGVDLRSLKVGDRFLISPPGPAEGDAALLEVTMIGKECKTPCRIYYQVGFCIMPREGVFCRVLRSGPVRNGDGVRIQRV
jgi:MOSC domain-containing protein YiiM